MDRISSASQTNLIRELYGKSDQKSDQEQKSAAAFRTEDRTLSKEQRKIDEIFNTRHAGCTVRPTISAHQ